ncbi:hypothetical protein I5M32_08415 [Pedobacter sp. SD-b]|uniref:Uncharacterized protein n=1 Tax=Pedobacter segetis TaxID=2793069 RepID=A0ABS1BJG4_9SPHI|nr:hypothetical protein [Pedobacter segetis]MBK0382982.1 hypothetical protein [Pedobacter segetis]
MKKLLFLFLGLSIIGITSCKKEYVTTPNQTIYYTIDASTWVTNDGGKTYTANLSFTNTDIYQNTSDGVLVYVSFADGVYEPVPQTYFGVSYSYEVNNQRVQLRIQSSDGSSTITPPGTISSKVVLIPSQQ